jgi:hypothetical protein
MIAEENKTNQMAVERAPGLGSDQNASRPSRLDAPLSWSNPGKRSRSGCGHSYSNDAMKTVTVIRPGPNCNRDGGGTEKNPAALLPLIFTVLESNISFEAAARATTIQLGADAITVSAVFQPRKGCSRRLAVPAGSESKPVNALGFIDPKTLTEAIHAFYLGLDKLAGQQELIRTSDTLTLNYDISSFNEHAQLGLVFHMMYINKVGKDACGQLLHQVVIKTICTNSLPASDKKAIDIFREDGSLFDKEVPCRLVMELALSGHLWEVMKHPCCFMGSDRGS